MATPCPEARGHPGNLGELFAEHAKSDRPAIIDLREWRRPRAVSFRELDVGGNAVARGLTRAGLAPGDRIGIVSLNRIEFVITLLGAMRAGVVPVPVNLKLPADAVAYILNDAGARIAFAEREVRRLIPGGIRVVEYGADFDKFVDPGPFNAFEPRPPGSGSSFPGIEWDGSNVLPPPYQWITGRTPWSVPFRGGRCSSTQLTVCPGDTVGQTPGTEPPPPVIY